jgi:hypothetical protein
MLKLNGFSDVICKFYLQSLILCKISILLLLCKRSNVFIFICYIMVIKLLTPFSNNVQIPLNAYCILVKYKLIDIEI